MIAIFPKIAAAVAAGDPEQLAVLVRQYFGGEAIHAVVPELQDYLQAIDIPLTRASMKGRGAIAARDVKGRFQLSAWLHPDVTIGGEEERLLLSHLLGHYFLHIQPMIMRGEWKDGGFKEMHSPGIRMIHTASAEDDRKRSPEDRQDREADAFAAAFLMPRAFVVRAQQQLGSVEKMARFFHVPVELMAWRLDMVQDVQVQPRDFIQAEIRLRRQNRSPAPGESDRKGAMAQNPQDKVVSGTSGTANLDASDISRLKGMDKIRNLARKMDKGVPKK